MNGRCETIQQRSNVIVHTPPFLDQHHDRRLCRACRFDDLAMRFARARLEVHPLCHLDSPPLCVATALARQCS